MTSESLVRQRFTIAHELGHFFLHPNKHAFVDYRDNIRGIVRSPREIQANAFAAALLMPRLLIQGDLRSTSRPRASTIKQLAATYCVSAEAMKYRLANLQMITPPQ